MTFDRKTVTKIALWVILPLWITIPYYCINTAIHHKGKKKEEQAHSLPE